MPTYEYECEACGHRFDELQSFKDDPLKVWERALGNVRPRVEVKEPGCDEAPRSHPHRRLRYAGPPSPVNVFAASIRAPETTMKPSHLTSGSKHSGA